MTIDELIEQLQALNEHDGALVMIGVSPTAMRHVREVRLCQDPNTSMGGKYIKVFAH